MSAIRNVLHLQARYVSTSLSTLKQSRLVSIRNKSNKTRPARVLQHAYQQMAKLFAVAVFLGLTAIAGPALAAPITPHAYALQRTYGPYYGAYFNNSLGPEDLTQNDRSAFEPFIDKELWFVFDVASTLWIETGDTVGIISGVDRVGHFYAENYIDSTGSSQYFEALIDGSSPVPTGEHNFTIGAGSSGIWNILVDGVPKEAISDFPTQKSADHEDIGIEASDDQTTFKSSTKSDNLQYQDMNGAWYYWNTSINQDSNTFGWSSAFTAPPSSTYPVTVFTHP